MPPLEREIGKERWHRLTSLQSARKWDSSPVVLRRGAINSNGPSGCFKGRTSYWIQTVPTGVKAANLTVWGEEITSISHSDLPLPLRLHNQRVVYIPTLTVLLKPKEAQASVSLPVSKMCYLRFNFTWPAEAIKGKGNYPVMYSKSTPCTPTLPRITICQYNL